MFLKPFPLTPGAKLSWAAMVMLLSALAVVWLTVRLPWLGLTLEIGDDRAVHITQAQRTPALLTPARLLALQKPGGDGSRVELQAADLVEEPDTLDSYAAIDDFLQRQQQLRAVLDGASVQISVVTPVQAHATLTLTPAPRRPLSSLPASFWVQLLTGAGGFLIGVWVWALRGDDLGARCFALTGAGLMLSAFSAAIYSTRELAVPAGLFRVLDMLNHLGAAVFGMALVALFLVFPRQLVKPQWLKLLPAIFLPWFVLDCLGLCPTPTMGMYLPALLQTGLTLLCIALQWWLSRGQPLERAALRWLGLAAMLTAALFTALQALPALLGRETAISQGHAFGLFLILYAGLALGLRRYRLFDLDRWAFRLLLWAGGAALLAAMDVALVALLHLDQGLSLTLAILICGFLWLPLRGWLWRKLIERRRLLPHDLFQRVLQVALAPDVESQRQRWRDLLHAMFLPLRIEPADHGGCHAALADNGLQLRLPASDRLPALALVHAHHGRRLFSPQDAALANEALVMLRHASDSRDAYNQGAREERARIARDLHDDIGSRLLTGLHQPELAAARRSIQQAIAEMRTVINGLTGAQMRLDEMLAELRHETAQRLAAAGIALDWPMPEPEAGFENVMLDYRHYRCYLPVLRELVSNVIRHAQARTVAVRIALEGGVLATTVGDDGVGMAAAGADQGRSRHGLANLQDRVAGLNGSATIEPPGDGGTHVRFTLPL